MASKEGIINSALRALGEDDSNTPLTDNSTWVRKIRNAYAEKLKLLLELHPWNFCTSIQQLTATEPSPTGWTYGYAKPATCLRILKVGAGANMVGPQDYGARYEDQAGRILADETTIYLKFIDSLKATEGALPQVFAEALSDELAREVGPTTSASTGKQDELNKLAAASLRRAKSWDAQQNPIWTPPASRWDLARRGGAGNMPGWRGNSRS